MTDSEPEPAETPFGAKANAPTKRTPGRARRRLRRWLTWFGIGVGAFMLLSIVAVGLLRWLDPPTSAFMLRQWIVGQFSEQSPRHVYHEWVDWQLIPGDVALAAIAAPASAPTADGPHTPSPIGAIHPSSCFVLRRLCVRRCYRQACHRVR